MNIAVKITIKNGDEQILAFHLPGELRGLDGMDNEIHSCSAIALNTTIVCELRVTELHNLCLRVEGLQRQLIGLLSDEICKDQNMLFLMARSNAEQKLCIIFYESISTFTTTRSVTNCI